jgi:hypothetical protein
MRHVKPTAQVYRLLAPHNAAALISAHQHGLASSGSGHTIIR